MLVTRKKVGQNLSCKRADLCTCKQMVYADTDCSGLIKKQNYFCRGQTTIGKQTKVGRISWPLKTSSLSNNKNRVMTQEKKNICLLRDHTSNLTCFMKCKHHLSTMVVQLLHVLLAKHQNTQHLETRALNSCVRDAIKRDMSRIQYCNIATESCN